VIHIVRIIQKPNKAATSILPSLVKAFWDLCRFSRLSKSRHIKMRKDPAFGLRQHRTQSLHNNTAISLHMRPTSGN